MLNLIKLIVSFLMTRSSDSAMALIRLLIEYLSATHRAELDAVVAALRKADQVIDGIVELVDSAVPPTAAVGSTAIVAGQVEVDDPVYWDRATKQFRKWGDNPIANEPPASVSVETSHSATPVRWIPMPADETTRVDLTKQGIRATSPKVAE